MDIGDLLIYLVIGAVVGPLARLLVPGKDPMSIVMTVVAGVIGALIGGLVFAQWITPNDEGIPWIAATVGAVLVVLVLRMMRRSRTA